MDFSISSSIFVLFTLVTILGGASIFFVFKKNLNDNFWEVIFFSSCLGLSFDIVSILILGFFKILYLKFFLCFQAIKLIILVISYSKIINYIREYKFNFCISLLFIISCILVSFHPAGGWDDTMYHLPAIRYYIENKGFEVAYFLRFPLFPQNIDILFCIPGLIFGANSILFEYFTQMQSTFCIIVTIFGVLAASKHFTDSYIYGSISALLMFSVITVVWYNGLAYIDNGVMLFCFAATLCLAMYIDSHKYFYFIISSIFAGITIGSKLFAFVFMCGLGVVYIAFNYKQWKNILIYIVIASGIGIWWYLRSWIISGDPFHPAGGPLFGFYLWDAQDLLIQIEEQRTHGVTKNISYLFDALNKADIEFFIFALGILPIYKNITNGLKVIFLSAFIYFLFWFYVTQVDRYITYIIPHVLVVISFIVYRIVINISDSVPKYLNKKIISSISIIVLLVCTIQESLAHGINLYKTMEFRRPGKELFVKANSFNDVSTMINVGFEDCIYFYNGRCLGDYYGYLKFRDLVDSNNFIIEPDKMIKVLKSHNAGLLVVNYRRHKINKDSYIKFFDIIKETDSGILLKLKDKTS